MYQKLDKGISAPVLAAVKKVERRKYGYMRKDELMTCGTMVILYQMVLDCKMRHMSLMPTLVRREAPYRYSLNDAAMTYQEIESKVNTR